MWVIFAFVSATIVGIRDFFKKTALQANSILMVLWLVTVFSAILFIPFIVISRCTGWLSGTFFYVPESSMVLHLCSMMKCMLLIACWVCSYDGIKHLPLTVSGMIAAIGPVETVIAAMVVYGETLNALQWAGVAVSTVSLIAICRGKTDEGTAYLHNRHFWMMLLSTLFSAAAALWDKFAMGNTAEGGLGLSVMFIQSWYNIYQALLLSIAVIWVARRGTIRERTHLAAKALVMVAMVSVCEVAADLLYDAALQLPGCMVSILAMVRRGSVVVSFALGALFLRERHIGNKAIDLALILAGMALLFMGS